MDNAFGSDAPPSCTLMGSTTIPQVTFTEDDAREYRSVADESFIETRALYEDFLYERKQSLDTRRWKHVRTKGTMKVYRQRSGSSDTSNFNISASSTSAAPGATSLSSTSSPDPLEVDDDALLIGPASSLSVATKIPVVVCTGTMQGKLDEVMYGIFVHDTASLQRRSIYGKDSIDDTVMLGTLESPTEANPFDFLGVAWILYSAPGLGAIVKQRDYVVLVRTGFATTSRGERIGFSIAQSISHPDLPELKSDDIVRASMSFCVIFRQQSDQIVEAFAHAVIDPGGTILTFFALQEIANSMLGMGAPIECAQAKKLRWYVHKTAAEKHAMDCTNFFDTSKSSSSSSSSATTEQTAAGRVIVTEDRNMCAYCRKSIGKLFSTQSLKCTVCHECVCKRCSVNKELVVRSSHSKSGMTAHSYNFCLGCFLAARNQSPVDIQREEVVYKRFVSR
ncbi:NADH-ubiquinone oxidoreductase chain 5 [Phytophthora cinnamomi]|uniref:NADH-ubiquinone oxidoreductase chain 5 n=1 Tax=Phytophthora cinnamomi TaxID=4785 RepID=UPI003559585F|nr:NADH-ubiquinone oxidoreductase chain 5 [Phytophthora cinnamomi]